MKTHFRAGVHYSDLNGILRIVCFRADKHLQHLCMKKVVCSLGSYAVYDI